MLTSITEAPTSDGVGDDQREQNHSESHDNRAWANRGESAIPM